MKFYLSLSPIYILFLTLVFSCSTEEEDITPPPTVQQPSPEPEPPAPTQYTLTVTASEGGTVSTEGGTYEEGTEVTITANANEGYSFTGWEGNDNQSNSFTISINSNLTIQANFQIIQSNEDYYSSGDIITIEPVVFYDRELIVNGIKLIIAGDIGGQLAVPDFWIYKTARVFQLLIVRAQEMMILMKLWNIHFTLFIVLV
jgi:uncharacterized repeat protein (TIGR02543 family)